MLSDEEKKAIEHLTKKMEYHKEKPLDTYVWLTLDEHYVRTILNLIEKQSKEIEELKQNIHLKEVYVLKTNDYIKGTNDTDELCNKKWEDKIKKEIEEIRKTHAPEDDYAESQIYILQSLLEKE